MPSFGEPTPIYEALTPTRVPRVGDVERQSWILAVDPDARTKPVHEYDLFLSPAEDGARFTVFRCARSFTLPEGACLVRAAEPTVVELWDVEFRVLPCLLVPPALVPKARSEHLLTVPPEMAGREIPERPPANEALWEILVDRDDFALPAPPATDDGRWRTGDAASSAARDGDGDGGVLDRVRSLFD